VLNRPCLMEIVRSMKMAVVERSVNSQVRPMLLISVLNRSHSNSSVVGSGSVSQIPNPFSMNCQRKERWLGLPGSRCCFLKIDT
jgi:hypothetical protein